MLLIASSPRPRDHAQNLCFPEAGCTITRKQIQKFNTVGFLHSMLQFVP